MEPELSFKHGRPKKWKDVKELQKALDKYFDDCDKNVIMHKFEEQIFEPYAVEGMCIVLECGRSTLLRYEKEKGYETFWHTIRKAKMRIKHQWVVNGLTGLSKDSFTKFVMINNSEYSDKQEIETSGENTITIDFTE